MWQVGAALSEPVHENRQTAWLSRSGRVTNIQPHRRDSAQPETSEPSWYSSRRPVYQENGRRNGRRARLLRVNAPQRGAGRPRGSASPTRAARRQARVRPARAPRGARTRVRARPVRGDGRRRRGPRRTRSPNVGSPVGAVGRGPRARAAAATRDVSAGRSGRGRRNARSPSATGR